MVRAQLYHLRGDTSLTRTWADTARRAISEQRRAVPDDARLHAFLGLVAAYLGRKAEAVEEGKRATALLRRWTLDLLIGRHRSLRAFSGPTTYPTEESAITGCCEFGRRIIDGRVRNCSVDDLS